MPCGPLVRAAQARLAKAVNAFVVKQSVAVMLQHCERPVADYGFFGVAPGRNRRPSSTQSPPSSTETARAIWRCSPGSAFSKIRAARRTNASTSASRLAADRASAFCSSARSMRPWTSSRSVARRSRNSCASSSRTLPRAKSSQAESRRLPTSVSCARRSRIERSSSLGATGEVASQR